MDRILIVKSELHVFMKPVRLVSTRWLHQWIVICLHIILCGELSISIIHIFNLEKYYKSDRGSNCPAEHIITEEHPCILATFRFHSTGYWGEIKDSRYPAGCFWNSRGDFTFNKAIDPSETQPELFGGNGGLCMNQGKWENGHYLKTFIKYDFGILVIR